MRDIAAQKEQQVFKTFVESEVVKSNDLPVTPQKQMLPLTSLDWKLFEQFCYRLIAYEPDTKGIPYLYGVPGEDRYITMIYDLCEDLHEPFSDRVFK